MIERYVTVIANASGYALGRVGGPSTPGQRWRLISASIESDSTARPTFRIYRNVVSPSNVMGSSRDGRLDSAGNDGETITAGETWLAEWQGCTPGASCTIALTFTP